MHHDQQPQDPLAARLISRLEATEALLAEERASKQALTDELLRLRAGSAATAGGGGGSSDGYDKDYDSPRPRPNSSGATTPVEGGAERGRRQGRGEAERPRPPWQNVLYKRQPYADNHVPGSFLEKLVTNAYVRQPDLRLYVINTFAVTQQISAVTLFLVVFMRTQDGLISVGTMVMVDLLLLFGGYATVFLVSPKRNNAGISGANGAAPGSLARLKGRAKHEGVDPYGRGGGSGGNGGGGVPLGGDEGVSPRTAAGLADGDGLDDLSLSSVSSTLASFFLFLAILRIMAPVLRTLTVSYSDDTIYALAVTLGFLHLAFHDYSYANTSSSGHFQARALQRMGTLSLNAAIFAAVLLASRLESNEKVFGLVLFALELFAFFPLARREVKRHSLLLHASVTSAMVLPTGLLLYLRHPTLFTAYLGTVVLVTVACPLWLLRVQRYKLRIEGPWDIAHVEAHP
ncbi:unnamed protein product [Ectocarpus fasciculatus]